MVPVVADPPTIEMLPRAVWQLTDVQFTELTPDPGVKPTELPPMVISVGPLPLTKAPFAPLNVSAPECVVSSISELPMLVEDSALGRVPAVKPEMPPPPPPEAEITPPEQEVPAPHCRMPGVVAVPSGS